MAQSYFAGVYWSTRSESVERTAQRIQDSLSRFRQIDPALQDWRRAGHASLSTENLDSQDTWVELLMNEDRGAGRGIAFDLLQNAPDDAAARLEIVCRRVRPSEQQLENHCILTLPQKGETRERLLKLDMLIRILGGLALSWEPDNGLVSVEGHFDSFTPSPRTPSVGWLTYLAAERGAPPKMPRGMESISIPGSGSITISTARLFSLQSADCLDAVSTATQILFAEGLLAPAP